MEMNLNNVVDICKPKTFTRPQANALLPIVNRICERHQGSVDRLLADQRYMLRCGASEERIKYYDTEIGKHLVAWGAKLTKLGLKVLGDSYIGFDTGFGYWSFRFGEPDILYYHEYGESPHKRRRLPGV